ncbi:glycosyltransferase family 2 protein [Roseateles sp. DXS20W]|uniref:Glycosyltransferase family 2 protein n=1 Tax=Pelomonas lactea TaxID=3299030 RepID=A0ABW7GGW0_9BURK
MTRADAARPWLSMLIPVYNVQDYLAQCVDSVLAQADEGVEVVLYDDCSTDGSRALMQTLADRHPGRLRLLDGDRNRGLSAARNRLLDASRGAWIWFLDSDDFLLPGAIAGLKAWADRDDVDLVLCDFRDHHDRPRLRQRLFGERHQRTQDIPPRQPWRDAGRLMEGALTRSQLHAWSKIARRALYGEDLRFPEGRYFEDVFVSPTLMLRAQTVVYVPEPWIAYRKRPGSILSTPNPTKWQDLQDSLNHLPPLLAANRARLDENTLNAATYLAYRSWMRATCQARRAGDWITVMRHLRQCEANSPTSLAAMLGYCEKRGWLWRALRIRAAVGEASRKASAQPPGK